MAKPDILSGEDSSAMFHHRHVPGPINVFREEVPFQDCEFEIGDLSSWIFISGFGSLQLVNRASHSAQLLSSDIHHGVLVVNS